MHDVLNKVGGLPNNGMIQALRVMYKGEKDLQRKIREGYVNDLKVKRLLGAPQGQGTQRNQVGGWIAQVEAMSTRQVDSLIVGHRGGQTIIAEV